MLPGVTICSNCNTEKPLSEFHRKGTGYQKACKVCRRKKQKAVYAERGKRRKDPKPKRTIVKEDFPKLQSRIDALFPRLQHVAAWYSRDCFEQEDIFQSMVESILKNCRPEDTDSYLLGCANNCVRSYSEKSNNYNNRVEWIDEECDTTIQSAFSSAESEFVRSEALEEIKKVIASLPGQYREIVYMLWCGEKKKEIAKKYAVSEADISSRLNGIQEVLSKADFSSLINSAVSGVY